jgi:hypothetical protein
MPRTKPVKDMTIIGQLSVGLTAEMRAAIEVVTAAYSTTPSQYARRALISQLVADGMIRHPAERLAAANSAKP